MIATIELICVFLILILWITIVVDMFKRKVFWGFCGLLAFLPSYYHVVKYYSGNRKIMAPLYISASLFVVISTLYAEHVGKEQMKPFFIAVSKNLKTECEFTGSVEQTPKRNIYFVWCAPYQVEKVTYQGVDDMVEKYKTKFIEPMIPYYTSNIHDPHFAIKFGIKSPHNMVGCYELTQEGIIKSWATGTEQACN